jgi:hypothetical protein
MRLIGYHLPGGGVGGAERADAGYRLWRKHDAQRPDPFFGWRQVPALASEDIPDQYPQSVLYSKPVEVIPHVCSAIGATAPPTYENAGHNNNLSASS